MNITVDKTTPSQSSPLHRHQSSLEGILDFSLRQPLTPEQRQHARRKLYSVIRHFEAAENGSQYNRPLLVRLTYEHARSEESQDVFLQTFFQSMALSFDGEELETDRDIDIRNEATERHLRSSLMGFADYLLDNFFLPLKASTRKTPQPSPVYHSALRRAQGAGLPRELVGTPERLSTLRGACLIRDRHRCVISRKFDFNEALRRFEADGDSARDDDNHLLKDDATVPDSLEVAHILPHSLTKADPGTELGSTREAALAILNMFDMGVAYLIEGAEIDRPRNALTLTHMLHQAFGDFRVFFMPITDAQPHTYRVDSFLPRQLIRDPSLPVIRTLCLAENRTIDPPSPRLLAIHCAISHILHLSGAGEYIDRLLRDVEEHGVQADGSTELGRLVSLGLSGWVDSVGVRL